MHVDGAVLDCLDKAKVFAVFAVEEIVLFLGKQDVELTIIGVLKLFRQYFIIFLILHVIDLDFELFRQALDVCW